MTISRPGGLHPPECSPRGIGHTAKFFCFVLTCMFYQLLRVPHIAVLLHSPGVVYYHLLLRQETRIPGVAPFSFRIGI